MAARSPSHSNDGSIYTRSEMWQAFALAVNDVGLDVGFIIDIRYTKTTANHKDGSQPHKVP